MTIKSFIQNDALLPRLRKREVLVVYDPERRYRELCLELAGDGIRVIDAGESSIESREAALQALQALAAQPPVAGLLVYVPAPAPVSDEDKMRDPFSLYGACGAVFPQGDGDSYLNLCLRAKADHAIEVRRIFEHDPNPGFAVIDAIGGGAGWPQLQGLLGVDSARDILFALLAPSEPQRAALDESRAWANEAKALLKTVLGLSLKTRGETLASIGDELWRGLLFSEFAFDLPEGLPQALAGVPRGADEARVLVEDLCDRLRNDQRTQAVYLARAEAIERELALPQACSGIADLGVKDTFPFEERTFFARAAQALQRGNGEVLRQVLGQRERSIWAGRGENRVQWDVLRAAAALAQACDDAERQLPDHARTMDALLRFYTSSLREVDRLHRAFEQTAGDHIGAEAELVPVIDHARKAYRAAADKVHAAFIRHLEKSGWPAAGWLANADAFDKLVAPRLLESGRRVALFLIDALRYELGVELHKQLSEDGQADVLAACAALPSVTPVGMASLLPDAGRDLRLTRKNDKLLPVLGDRPLANVDQRMEVLRGRYGQRFHTMALKDFARSKAALPATTELLVLRSNEMDQDFETNPDGALTLVSRTFQQIRQALRRLADLGFQDAVIVTDHGFHLNLAAEAGDVCIKPTGHWVEVHGRLLLGEGNGDSGNFALPAEALGMRGDFARAAGPRALIGYQSGMAYLHGGASLQELIVPAITVKLRATERAEERQLKVTLTYKRGSKRTTTRLPVVEVTVNQGDLFASPVEVLIEAHDKAGRVVGEARPGGPINPATRVAALLPGEPAQVTVGMDDKFEGKFTIKALDPRTMVELARIDLETDYTV